ncbi:MAG: hypothetical protein F9K32_09855 [Desulfobulbaceae bacterium]|nr:MAG: hypothetical protein F9K32_09855 [Desulfobulbaceae bacterium]
MIFETDIFVDQNAANEMLLETKRKFGTISKKQMRRDEDLTELMKALNELANYFEYKNLVGNVPDFDKKDPLIIERLIIECRYLLEGIGKENNFSLCRLLANLQDTARATYASRACYHFEKR